MIKTTTEKRADGRIFAGSDPVYTATGTSGISVATPSLTPLMLDDASGKLVAWDGQKAGTAVGVLVLALAGTEPTLTYYKKRYVCHRIAGLAGFGGCGEKANAFVGSAISHA